MTRAASVGNTALQHHVKGLAASLCLALFGLGAASAALAQSTTAPTASSSPTAQTVNKTAAPQALAPKPSLQANPALNSKPAWTDLTPAQQQALKPLAGNWASLSVESKRKWLAISKSYPNLPPSEQAKAHSRMSEWVSLSQQQRTEARLNFAETKKLPPQEKATQWQSYQELSPEAKKKLAAQAPATPAGAAVVKPIPQKKLTEVPVTPHTPTQGAKLSGANQSVHQKTLLPQAPAQAETAPKQ